MEIVGWNGDNVPAAPWIRLGALHVDLNEIHSGKSHLPDGRVEGSQVQLDAGVRAAQSLAGSTPQGY